MKKIGKGYYQTGYGKGFKKSPIVREINGKAYVKDGQASPFQTDLDGHVMVNRMRTPHGDEFYAIGLIKDHLPYNPS